VLASPTVHGRIALLALVVAALPAPAAASDADVEVAAEVGTGLDTNPRRLTGDAGPAGGFGFAQVRARGRLTGERLRLDGRVAQAGRLYPGASDATASASRADLGASVALSDHLSLGATLAASDYTERAHRLDEDAAEAQASLSWSGGELAASLSGGWNGFLPRGPELRPFRASGPEGSLRASWAPAQQHAFSAAYTLWAAAYPRWREAAPGARRDDRTHTVSAEYAHRGALVAALGYAFAWNRSGAAGADYQRHRVTARCAAFLPYDFTVAARGALQWSRYPDPLLLQQQELLLAQGQENQDALEVRLTHPLTARLEIALSVAWYGGEIATGPSIAAPGFSRVVATTTVGWRGGWR
jgi:hypothetical protein